MALQEIPLRSDSPAFKFQVTLDTVEYTLQFSWNSRMSRWFFDILTSDGTAILMGQPVLVNFALIARFKDVLLPPGRIYFYDTSGLATDPDRFDLGSRVVMYYEDEAENE
jgi:hypothetical protein